MKVLIISPDENLISNVKRCLKTLGVQVFSAPDSSESFLVAKNRKPNIIFIDNGLPFTTFGNLKTKLESLEFPFKCVKMCSVYSNTGPFSTDPVIMKPVTEESLQKVVTC
jgi:two-component SAPR family response regulator